MKDNRIMAHYVLYRGSLNCEERYCRPVSPRKKICNNVLHNVIYFTDRTTPKRSHSESHYKCLKMFSHSYLGATCTKKELLTATPPPEVLLLCDSFDQTPDTTLSILISFSNLLNIFLIPLRQRISKIS